MSMENYLYQQYRSQLAAEQAKAQKAKEDKQEQLLALLTTVKAGNVGTGLRNQYVRGKMTDPKLLYNQETGVPIKVQSGMEKPNKDFMDMLRKNFWLKEGDFMPLDYSGLSEWGETRPTDAAIEANKMWKEDKLGIREAFEEYFSPDMFDESLDAGTEVLPEVTGEGTESLLSMLDLPEGTTETLGEVGGALGPLMSAVGLAQGLNQFDTSGIRSGAVKNKRMRGGALGTGAGAMGLASAVPGPHQAVTAPAALILSLLNMSNSWLT